MSEANVVLRTERFTLSRPAPSDLAEICRMLADDETRRFLGPSSPDEKGQFERLMRNAGSWSLYGYGTLAVRAPGSEEIIASCGIFHSWRGFGQGMDDTPEAGWIVRHDHWRQGIAREVMQAVLEWFDRVHGPRRIACMIERGNQPSDKLARWLGFIPYGEYLLEQDGVAEPVMLDLYERLPA